MHIFRKWRYLLYRIKEEKKNLIPGLLDWDSFPVLTSDLLQYVTSVLEPSAIADNF